MMPGMNPKKMKQMMKQIGMTMDQLEDVRQVVIYTAKGTYVFDQPEVVSTTMQGMTSYQVTGQPEFRPAEVQIPEEDVMMVAEQTGATPEDARAALKACDGDIAEAILKLTGE
jgi:nascent polypeptide-associated complex subunit alpha